MIDISKLTIGQKVHWQSNYDDRCENGMIKEIDIGIKGSVRVVYNCDNNWKEFKNYTGILTHLRDLQLGWAKAEIQKIK